MLAAFCAGIEFVSKNHNLVLTIGNLAQQRMVMKPNSQFHYSAHKVNEYDNCEWSRSRTVGVTM